MDIKLVLDRLWACKRIFVSEADFQFSLAWQIKAAYPDAEIRLEYIPWQFDRGMHIDILVLLNGKMIPIELKYKTKHIAGSIQGEEIYLKDHSAHDCGRYDFLKDVQRLEEVSGCGIYPIEEAYAVLLTNDPAYWRPSSKPSPVDQQFRIHEGAVISGARRWGEGAGAGTIRSREGAIELRGTYCITWQDYNPVDACQFKYCVVRVNRIG